jgi:hypothetical protein
MCGPFQVPQHRRISVETVDFSVYFVVYNFIIGVLVMIASEKLGIYAGLLIRSRRVRVGRLTRMVTFTFGASVAVLMGGIYLAGYVLKL